MRCCLDWWATALDREAQAGTPERRLRLAAQMAARMEEELRRDPGSAPANYWLAVAARAAGDLDAAWDAAVARMGARDTRPRCIGATIRYRSPRHASAHPRTRARAFGAEQADATEARPRAVGISQAAMEVGRPEGRPLRSVDYVRSTCDRRGRSLDRPKAWRRASCPRCRRRPSAAPRASPPAPSAREPASPPRPLRRAALRTAVHRGR